VPGLRLLKPTLLAGSVNPAADGPALPRARGPCRGARWTRAVSTLCELRKRQIRLDLPRHDGELSSVPAFKLVPRGCAIRRSIVRGKGCRLAVNEPVLTVRIHLAPPPSPRSADSLLESAK